jgi:hypothetical protein
VPATATASIGPAFAGLSYEKSSINESPYLFTASNANLIGLFKRIGPSVLRIGGNSVDKNVWNASGAGNATAQVAPADVAALAAFVKAAGWRCLYDINLGGSATGATTPALATAEVAYAYQQFGSSLLGIEIGNECDLYAIPATTTPETGRSLSSSPSGVNTALPFSQPRRMPPLPAQQTPVASPHGRSRSVRQLQRARLPS